MTDYVSRRYRSVPGYRRSSSYPTGGLITPAPATKAIPPAGDYTVRATVWIGTETGRWYVDVYYADRRTPDTPAYLRSQVDRAPRTTVIERDFDTRHEALTYANRTVGSMRLSAALAAGTAPLDERAAAWVRAARAGADQEDDCDA